MNAITEVDASISAGAMRDADPDENIYEADLTPEEKNKWTMDDAKALVLNNAFLDLEDWGNSIREYPFPAEGETFAERVKYNLGNTPTAAKVALDWIAMLVPFRTEIGASDAEVTDAKLYWDYCVQP